MCNLYAPVPPEKIAMQYAVAAPVGNYAPMVGPFNAAPIIVPGPRALVAQWGLIPPSSRTRIPLGRDGRRLSTNNARRERLQGAPTFRAAWQTGQRCLIPALYYDEPYWGSGKNVWWRFWRSDGEPWALAGIWSEWQDPETGEVIPSYSMITQNCDGHPVLARMHKPDPTLPPDQQDKRAVVPLEPQHWDQWLHGNAADADVLIQLPDEALLRHGPANPSENLQLPLI